MGRALASWVALFFGIVTGAGTDLSCDIFLAPSKLNNGGWGVFSARDFFTRELVEIAPLFIPVNHTDFWSLVKNSVLDDYTYGYRRGGNDEMLTLVAMGMALFYNHDRHPNIVLETNLGREPSVDDPNSANAVGFFAKHDIHRGQELFVSYNPADNGVRWFQDRRIEMQEALTEESRIPLQELDLYRTAYCSKTHAGYGSVSFQERVRPNAELFHFDFNWKPMEDAPMAVAKVAIPSGDRVEIAPALVLHRDMITDSALAPFGIFWETLTTEHQQALLRVREDGQLKLQYQGPDTNWHRVDTFTSFETIVLLPLAGSIGLIERVGSVNPNRRMEMKTSGSDANNAGLVLEVIATKEIVAGETLRLNLAPAGSASEREMLVEILKETGQPISESLRQTEREELSDEL